MDEDVADLVSTELKEFFNSLTIPFLDRLPALDRLHAVLWSQRITDMKNYPLMKKFLLLLTYMIVSGRIVSPFDVDARKCPLPPFELDLKDPKLFNYVQEEIARLKSREIREQTQSALSNDEKAFLAQLPSPRNGVRLYLATSNEPYSEWSKSRHFPAPTKYDVSRSEFVNDGLALVQKKFETYQRNKTDGEQPAENKSKKKSVVSGSDCDSSVDGRCSSTSSNGHRSLHQEAHGQQNDIESSSQPRECVIEISPNEQAVIREVNGVVTDDLPDSTPSTATEEDARKEELVQMKGNRWFGNSMYDNYRETIKKLLRKKLSVDTIRRNIHRCMRQRYRHSTQIPLWIRDSLDESEPHYVRREHLKLRFADVLKNDYGMTNDEDIFCVASMSAFNADKERKVRELIKRAEERQMDPKIRQFISRHETKSCGYFLRLIDDLLAATEDGACLDRSGTSNGTASFEYPGTDEAWPPSVESSRDLESSTSSAYPQSRTSTADSTANGSLESLNGSRRSSRTAKTPSSHACCPPGHQTRVELRKERKPDSSPDTSADFDLEDVTPTELFKRLPPDTSDEDASKNNNKK